MTDYTQTEAFPRSTVDILEQLRGVHSTALEKAIDALDALSDDEKIARRYEKAEEKVAGCRELLGGIDRALADMRRATVNQIPATETALSGGLVANEGQDATRAVFCPESPDCDPITGEVVSKPHTGEEISQTPHVFVVWPDEAAPLATPIGEHTTYGELVADYLSDSGAAGDVWDYRVVRSGIGMALDLNAKISPADYGAEFRIEPKVAKAQEPAA